MTDQLIIFDTTLRDGQQTPGVDYSLEDKLVILEMLDRLGLEPRRYVLFVGRLEPEPELDVLGGERDQDGLGNLGDVHRRLRRWHEQRGLEGDGPAALGEKGLDGLATAAEDGRPLPPRPDPRREKGLERNGGALERRPDEHRVEGGRHGLAHLPP